MKSVIAATLMIICSFDIQAQEQERQTERQSAISIFDRQNEEINFDIIPSYVLPEYDNDSLFLANNHGKSPQEVGSHFAAGIRIKKNIDFRSNAMKLEMDDGTVYLFSVKSSSAKKVAVILRRFDLPNGSYLNFTTSTPDPSPLMITRDNMDRYFRPHEDYFWGSGFEGEVIVEYFEPRKCVKHPTIEIIEIVYTYVNPFMEL